MTGIYIKGMEMPTEQYGKMVITLYPNGHVAEYIGDIGRVWEAVPVPAHGRLIDADALMGVIRAHDYPLTAHFNSTDNGMFTLGIQQAVDEAPTIIPAEEGE